ncbi:hypothetical protein B0T22DRAFT_465299 [Podospora appendiculata]|uniref:Uncharacterized protein n=1 Tax=Podospora appendiculata TaxID=314037 RepID=A0AAE0X4Z6_9PEZI|nr:hypothetical protein B0T22DRAFT_465299 [Podospora appendiculata]
MLQISTVPECIHWSQYVIPTSGVDTFDVRVHRQVISTSSIFHRPPRPNIGSQQSEPLVAHPITASTAGPDQTSLHCPETPTPTAASRRQQAAWRQWMRFQPQDTVSNRPLMALSNNHSFQSNEQNKKKSTNASWFCFFNLLNVLKHESLSRKASQTRAFPGRFTHRAAAVDSLQNSRLMAEPPSTFPQPVVEASASGHWAAAAASSFGLTSPYV